MEIELLQLMLTKGIGNVSLSKILSYIDANSTSLKEICANRTDLANILNHNSAMIENFHQMRKEAEYLCKKLEDNQVKVLTKYDLDYPKRLIRTLGNNCPCVIFVKGNVNLLNSNSIGFCGSRKVSDKGLIITESCAKQLANNNITVVSGYAKGTDLAAHTNAMKNGGCTVFVLAEGILNYKIKPLIKDLTNNQNHVFVSQFLPYSVWSPSNAMKRNSLIIGLSKAMILIESRNTGGTFAAGVETLKRRLPLFVVDYSCPEDSAVANEFFIQNGGNPIRGKNNEPNLTNIINISKSQDSFDNITCDCQLKLF